MEGVVVIKSETSESKKIERKATDYVQVTNIPFTHTEQDLSDIFTGFKVARARLVCRRNGRSCGWGLVKFSSEEEKQRALTLDGSESGGRCVSIEVWDGEMP